MSASAIKTPPQMAFDADAYWRDRLASNPTLESTGTRPFGLQYQRYLYRLKEAAIRRVLQTAGRSVRGAEVLNAGCGWGYFEPVFDAWGAAGVTGMDFVARAVAELQRRRPQYPYLAGDISAELPPALTDRTFDVPASPPEQSSSAAHAQRSSLPWACYWPGWGIPRPPAPRPANTGSIRRPAWCG
jgi:hypothetical protein